MSVANTAVKGRDAQGVEARTSGQYSSFRVQGKRYCVLAVLVQEIVKPLPITPLPLAPRHVHGLINLRGQIVTALGVRELFGLETSRVDDKMNVVCHLQGTAVSLLVDEIGDVVEFPAGSEEPVPDSVSPRIRGFLCGVFKTDDEIYCIVDLDKVMDYLNSEQAQTA